MTAALTPDERAMLIRLQGGRPVMTACPARAKALFSLAGRGLARAQRGTGPAADLVFGESTAELQRRYQGMLDT